MPHVRPLGDICRDRVLEEARVSKIEAFIYPDRQEFRGGEDGMPFNIPVMLRARHLADNGDVRLAGPVKMQQQRKRDAGDDTKFYAPSERDEDRGGHGSKVGFRIGKYPTNGSKIHQRKHRDNDRSRERCLRQARQ